MSDYLEGELGGRRQRRITRHAEACPDCGPMLRGLMRIRIVLGSFGRPRTQATVVPLVLERIREDEASTSAGPTQDSRS